MIDETVGLVLCRRLVEVGLEDMRWYAGDRFHAELITVDGAWGDYWRISLDGEEIGEVHLGAGGPEIHGDALAEFAIETMDAGDRRDASTSN